MSPTPQERHAAALATQASVLADFVATKDAHRADPTAANKAAKQSASAQLDAAKQEVRITRPPLGLADGAVRGEDAEAFLPVDQGGNTARALALLELIFDARGDTTSDPATVLAAKRAAVIANRSI